MRAEVRDAASYVHRMWVLVSVVLVSNFVRVEEWRYRYKSIYMYMCAYSLYIHILHIYVYVIYAYIHLHAQCHSHNVYDWLLKVRPVQPAGRQLSLQLLESRIPLYDRVFFVVRPWSS